VATGELSPDHGHGSLNVEVTMTLNYHIYSHISRPAYKLAMMLNAELTLAVWHDPCISRPPTLQRHNLAKNCQLICEYIQ